MGLGHARQVSDLGPQIIAAIENRLSTLETLQIDYRPLVSELTDVLEEIARPTLEMLRGMADGLSLDWERFYLYTVATYLMDRTLYPLSDNQDCTTWAASGSITQDGKPILAKNRDYWPDHRHLQCLAWAKPKEGYQYLYLTSAGSPGVFSSGMNEAGLAVTDTHVVSLDIGPGIPRYTLMMELLEHFKDVRSGLEYLLQVSHMGNGTLILLDETGDLVVVETGHTQCGLVHPTDGFVVSTNHYVSAELRDHWVSRGPEEIHGNSRRRYARVSKALRGAQGKIDLNWAQSLMSSHGNLLGAICRHPSTGPRSVTISSILFSPQERKVHLAAGLPCRNEFNTWSLIE